jgi:hypothetical protein
MLYRSGLSIAANAAGVACIAGVGLNEAAELSQTVAGGDVVRATFASGAVANF